MRSQGVVRSLKTWLRCAFFLGALSAVPGHALAMGLGALRIHSALGQKFSANIPLHHITGSALSELSVTLAPSDVFEDSGIAMPDYLHQLTFDVEREEGGEASVHVASLYPMSVPYLQFIVAVKQAESEEVFYKSYTVLLDPPEYGDTETATPEKERLQKTVAKPSQTTKAAPSSARAIPQTLKSKPLSDTVPAAPLLASTRGGRVYGPTHVHDNLLSIAKQVRGETPATLSQVMLAIYRKNPRAFLHHNINELQAGVRLVIPSDAEILSIPPKEAMRAFMQDNKAWLEEKHLHVTKQPKSSKEPVPAGMRAPVLLQTQSQNAEDLAYRWEQDPHAVERVKVLEQELALVTEEMHRVESTNALLRFQLTQKQKPKADVSSHEDTVPEVKALFADHRDKKVKRTRMRRRPVSLPGAAVSEETAKSSSKGAAYARIVWIALGVGVLLFLLGFELKRRGVIHWAPKKPNPTPPRDGANEDEADVLETLPSDDLSEKTQASADLTDLAGVQAEALPDVSAPVVPEVVEKEPGPQPLSSAAPEDSLSEDTPSHAPEKTVTPEEDIEEEVSDKKPVSPPVSESTAPVVEDKSVSMMDETPEETLSFESSPAAIQAPSSDVEEPVAEEKPTVAIPEESAVEEEPATPAPEEPVETFEVSSKERLRVRFLKAYAKSRNRVEFEATLAKFSDAFKVPENPLWNEILALREETWGAGGSGQVAASETEDESLAVSDAPVSEEALHFEAVASSEETMDTSDSDSEEPVISEGLSTEGWSFSFAEDEAAPEAARDETLLQKMETAVSLADWDEVRALGERVLSTGSDEDKKRAEELLEKASRSL